MAESGTGRRGGASETQELTIGQLARVADTSPDALRYYERRGLLTPTRRTQAGYRLYDRSAVERLDFIRKAQAIGLKLDQVIEVLRAAADGGPPCEHVRATLEVRLRQVDARLRDLRALRATLVDALSKPTVMQDSDSCICGIIESQSLSRRITRRRKEGI